VTHYSIQTATENHQAAIKELIGDVGINPMGLKWQRFLVALDNTGHIIGCGQVKLHRDGSRELASIAVEKAWRNQGVARAIIKELVKQHQRPLWLTCMSRLMPFYAQFGFVDATGGADLPSYYRWSLRLFPIYARLRSVKGYLAVMVLSDE